MRGSSRMGALMASEVLTGAPRDPDAAAFLVLAVADPGRLVLGVDHHHVAHVDGSLLRDDPARLGTTLVGADPGVLLRSHGHSTSGASEMIRMKRLSRSSRPTGPKMRVPRGSPLSRMMTAAFSSKRM